MQSIIYSKVVSIFRMIKFTHTVFALPFAIVSFVVNMPSTLPSVYTILFILLALIFARSLAMAFNRLVDYKYDKENPRTNQRELVTGEINKSQIIIFIIVNCLAFITSAYLINLLSFYLSFPLIALLLGYSYLKRFSFLVHFYLGMVIGFVPLGVDIALSGSISLSSILLFLGLAFWISGFDIIYSLLDIDFDRDKGLYSIASYFGISKALLISRLSYVVMIISLLIFGFINSMNILYYLGILGILCLLVYEHIAIKRRGVLAIDSSLFFLNGLISIIYLLVFLFGIS